MGRIAVRACEAAAAVSGALGSLLVARPAQDGTLPVNLNHSDSLGASRSGSSDETSVDDFKRYHQYETGSFKVANLACMSRAIVRHCRSHAPFCLGTCSDMVVSRTPW
eukprot:119225-Pleurochrysis_carterae.AAC.5